MRARVKLPGSAWQGIRPRDPSTPRQRFSKVWDFAGAQDGTGRMFGGRASLAGDNRRLRLEPGYECNGDVTPTIVSVVEIDLGS